jgi:hypothetical protein
MPYYEITRRVDERWETDYWEISEIGKFTEEENVVIYSEEYLDCQKTPEKRWDVQVEAKDIPESVAKGYQLVKDSKHKDFEIELEEKFKAYFTKIKKDK